MSAGDNLNERQFPIATPKGEMTVRAHQHRMVNVPVEHLQKGMWARPHWQEHMPFERLAGPSEKWTHAEYYGGDPVNGEHEESQGDFDLYTANYKRRFGPHYPEGTHFSVLWPKRDAFRYRQLKRRIEDER